MKKILAIALALMMILTLAACNKGDKGNNEGEGDDKVVVQSSTYTDATTGDVLGYAVNDKGSYEITSFSSQNHTPHKVEIPASINGVEVTGIGDHAFKVNNQVSEIVLPDSLLYVGDWAFFGCGNITSITLPDSVEEIGYGAFSDCASLKSVKLSAKLAKINDFAFRNCTVLESVTIPASVKEIGGAAFFMCEALTELTIPATVETIGDGAFMKCTKLAKATVADGVKTIGARVFDDAAEGFVVVATEDSVAAKYAADNGYGFTKAE